MDLGEHRKATIGNELHIGMRCLDGFNELHQSGFLLFLGGRACINQLERVQSVHKKGVVALLPDRINNLI